MIVAFEESAAAWGVFSEQSLKTIKRLTDAIEKVPYVRAVRSLTATPWIRWGEAAPGEQGLLVSDLFENEIDSYSDDERLRRMISVIGAERAAQLAGVDAVKRVLGPGESLDDHVGEPRFINGIVSADGRTAALQVQILRDRPSPERLERAFGSHVGSEQEVGAVLHSIESQAEAVDAIRQIVDQESGYPVHLAGIPVLEQHFPKVGMRDMAFIALMFLVMGLVLFAVFRRTVGVVLPLAVVLASILGMNGVVWFAGDLVNNLTATAPIVMTTVGIADAVHLVAAYYVLRPQFSDRRRLIIEVVRQNALPVSLTSLTTAAAFFSLVISKITPVQQFGYTAGIGTVIAYVISMTAVPALLSLIPIPEPSREQPQPVDATDKHHWSDGLLDWALRRRWAVAAGSMMVLGLALFGMSRVRVESDLRQMFPDDDPVTSDLRWIERRLGGAGDLDLVFYGPELERDSSDVYARQQRIEELELRRMRGAELDPPQAQELTRLQAAEADQQRRKIAGSAAFLQQVDAFERRLRAESADPTSPLRVLTSFDSGLSVLRRIHQVQHENRAAFYRVPALADVPPAARQATVIEDYISGETSYIPHQTADALSAQYYLQYENAARPSRSRLHNCRGAGSVLGNAGQTRGAACKPEDISVPLGAVSSHAGAVQVLRASASITAGSTAHQLTRAALRRATELFPSRRRRQCHYVGVFGRIPRARAKASRLRSSSRIRPAHSFAASLYHTRQPTRSAGGPEQRGRRHG